MARARSLILLVLVAAVVAPASADAGTGGRTIARAVSVARHYWGATACHGAVAVRVRQDVPAGLQGDTDAWVTFGSTLGANVLSAPADGFTRCTVSLGRTRWPTASSLASDWDMLCMTMVHEVGHLLGHAHDETPGSVMAPVFSDYSAEPRLCRASRPGRSRGV